MKVFSVTAVMSIFAYIWLYVTLQTSSFEVIESWEAWSTFTFFFILIGMAFGADKWTQYIEDKRKTDEEKLKDKRDQAI